MTFYLGETFYDILFLRVNARLVSPPGGGETTPLKFWQIMKLGILMGSNDVLTNTNEAGEAHYVWCTEL